MWSKNVVKKRGQNTRSKNVVKICVAKIKGKKTWSKNMVKKRGQIMLSKYVVKKCGQKTWSKKIYNL